MSSPTTISTSRWPADYSTYPVPPTTNGKTGRSRDADNKILLKHIEHIHAESRGAYGSPRVHAELTMGREWTVNEKRVARLTRQAGIQGLYRQRRHGCTIRDPHAEPYKDLVDRQFTATGPDRLWVTDITEHPTGEGKLYCAAVLDAFSRRIVGWSIAEHMKTELVLDALGMAVLRRDPVSKETILHSDHGSQFTSWRFGQRLQKAEILGSMGSVGDCYDNAMMESFWGTLQLEVLDSKEWNSLHLAGVEGDLRPHHFAEATVRSRVGTPCPSHGGDDQQAATA